MRLSLLLSFLSFKLKKNARKYDMFKNYLMDKHFTLQVKTANGRNVRYFSFNKGDVVSRRGQHTKPDVTMLWNNAKTAFKVMTDKDEEAMLHAMMDKKLRILGESHYVLVFGNIVKEMFGAKSQIS